MPTTEDNGRGYTAHTPGPWRYLEDHDGDAAGRPLTVCDSANNDLANIYSREDATVRISRAAAIGNARLIAVAPDLAQGAQAFIEYENAISSGNDVATMLQR